MKFKILDSLEWLRSVGVSQRIIRQFLLIFSAAVAALALATILYMRYELLHSLADKSRVVASSVAGASVDPLSVGDSGRLSREAAELKASDRDVTFVHLYDLSGKCLGSTDPEQVGKSVAGTGEGNKLLAADDYSVLRDQGFGGYRVVMPLRFVYNKIGYLEIGYTERNANMVVLQSALVAALVALLALALGVYFYFGQIQRHITVPLAEVMQVSGKIASGDLTGQEVEMRSSDEIGLLGDSFNKMSFGLRALIGDVSEVAATTNKSALEMARSTAQSSETMKQIQGSISQIATATSAVAANAQQISSLTHSANKSAETGALNIGKVKESFSVVLDVIRNTDDSVAKLEQRSHEIAQILSLITKIADQTNMLALNAAIEAARAGEAGRGFSVVADEVRKLAESSNQSAAKIAVIVSEIQKDTAGVASGSAKSIRETRNAVGLVAEMQAGYSGIVESIRGIGEQVEQIAATAEETASSAEEVTAGAEEQTAAIAQISSSADELHRYSKKLQDQVGFFKV